MPLFLSFPFLVAMRERAYICSVVKPTGSFASQRTCTEGFVRIVQSRDYLMYYREPGGLAGV